SSADRLLQAAMQAVRTSKPAGRIFFMFDADYGFIPRLMPGLKLRISREVLVINELTSSGQIDSPLPESTDDTPCRGRRKTKRGSFPPASILNQSVSFCKLL